MKKIAGLELNLNQFLHVRGYVSGKEVFRGAKEIYERLMIDFQVRLWFVQCLRSF